MIIRWEVAQAAQYDVIATATFCNMLSIAIQITYTAIYFLFSTANYAVDQHMLIIRQPRFYFICDFVCSDVSTIVFVELPANPQTYQYKRVHLIAILLFIKEQLFVSQVWVFDFTYYAVLMFFLYPYLLQSSSCTCWIRHDFLLKLIQLRKKPRERRRSPLSTRRVKYRVSAGAPVNTWLTVGESSSHTHQPARFTPRCLLARGKGCMPTSKGTVR